MASPCSYNFSKKRPREDDLCDKQPAAKLARHFQECWQREFSFISYNAKSKSMLCDLCVKCQCSNSFTTGCTVLKKESITKHIKTKDHKKAEDASKLRVHMEAAQTSLVSKSEDAVLCAMANVVFLAKEDLPSSMAPAFNEFLVYQGLSILSHLKADAHTTYCHSNSIDDFQEAIASVLQDELVIKVNTSEKYSLMFDESTDISVHQNLIMYIRLLEKNSLGVVEPVTYFLGIDSVPRANAETIYLYVLNTLSKKGIDISGLCSVSTDGASVMVGAKSGVVTRLRTDAPGMLATHCIAHRLALSCCSGADAIPYLVKVQETLNSIYKYFHFSPKNMATLETAQKLTPGQSGKFKEVFHTRWLSFEASVEAFVKNYSSLISVFLEEATGKALSMYKPITCYKFLYVVHFLCDVLGPLAVLSKTYQKSDIDYSQVTPLLKSTVSRLETLSAKKNGTRLTQFLSQVPGEPTVDSDGLMTFDYAGHTIRDGEKQRREAVGICDKFVAGVICSLHARFADNDDGAVLTSLTNYFNPVIGKDSKDDDVEVISEYLLKIGHEGSVDELSMFMCYANTLVAEGNKSVCSIRDVANLAIRNKDLYPATAEAASRLLVAPVSTVDCERGFSKQNIIKTCLRNRMSVGTLDKLLRISLDRRSIGDFPLKQAYKKWAANKKRRILQ